MKRMISLLIGLLFLVGMVVAQPVPEPVTFTVVINEMNAHYEFTSVKNLATGEVLTPDDVAQLKIVNGVGGFLLSKFKLGVEGASIRSGYPGDTIEAKVCDVSPLCTFTFHADYTNPNEFTFHTVINDETIPDDVIAPPQVYVCPDGSEVSDPSQCPAEEDPVEDQPTEDDLNEVLAAILFILGGGAAGSIVTWFARQRFGREGSEKFLLEIAKHMRDYSGFRVVKWRGKVSIKHLHPGISGYHSPDIVHKNESAKHEKGKLLV